MTGRMSQDKGKRAERDLANWWKDMGYPDAARAVKTGDRFSHDGGDLVLRHGPFTVVIEVKHHDGGLSDIQVAQFGTKLLQQMQVSRALVGAVVERRDRVSDAGRWWAHIHVRDLALLELGRPELLAPCSGFRPARVSVGYLAGLLRRAGLAAPIGGVVSSATSPPDGAAQLAGMAVADGVSP